MCTKEQLSNLVRNYLEIDSEIKARQVILESIKNSIKKEMDLRNVDELEVDEHIVRYKDVLISSFNTSAFKAKYELLYTSFLKQIQCKKFSIA